MKWAGDGGFPSAAVIRDKDPRQRRRPRRECERPRGRSTRGEGSSLSEVIPLFVDHLPLRCHTVYRLWHSNLCCGAVASSPPTWGGTSTHTQARTEHNSPDISEFGTVLLLLKCQLQSQVPVFHAYCIHTFKQEKASYV